MFDFSKLEIDEMIRKIVVEAGKIRANDLFNELVELGVEKFKNVRVLGSYISWREIRGLKKVLEKRKGSGSKMIFYVLDQGVRL